jgi:hypothetical protein
MKELELRSILAVLTLVIGLTITTVALGDIGPPPPPPQDPVALSPADAQVLIDTGSVSGGTTTSEVSPADVTAAMSTPGAVNFGTDPIQDSAAGPLIPIRCWAVNSYWTWGTYPYNQHLNSLTYWCAHYNQTVTTISLSPTATGVLCSGDATGSLVAGGVGFSSFVEQAYGNWACPTAIPWIIIHTHHYLQTSHNSIGVSRQVAHG